LPFFGLNHHFFQVNGITGQSWTFNQGYEEVRAFGSSLIKNGFSRGDTMAILLPNMPQYVIGVCGAIGDQTLFY